MSKLVIVLFAVLTVVAPNASCTPVKLENQRDITESDIVATETYIQKKYDDAFEEHDKLKNHIEKYGAQKVTFADDQIMTIIIEAREQIENLKDGVELLDDEACLYHAAHLTDKKAEASTNLTNCVSNKSKVSTDSELGYITDTKRATLYQSGNSYDEMDSCMDNNGAERCLSDIQVKMIGYRSAIDTAVARHMAKIREMFASAAESFDFCETEYGAPNYSKFITPIVNKVAECFKTGAHAHRIRLDLDV